MNEISNNAPGSMSPASRDGGIDARIFRTMGLAAIFAVIASLPFGQWRITTGLLLGGLLALLNHRWLSNSTAAAFSVLVDGARPKLKVAQYILRYFVIATVVFVAYKLNVVSLTATIIGLCSFVVALFAEACREFYVAIIHREEIS
jgi:hypothetical protein